MAKEEIYHCELLSFSQVKRWKISWRYWIWDVSSMARSSRRRRDSEIPWIMFLSNRYNNCLTRTFFIWIPSLHADGHDIKSLLINLASFLLFILPFGVYYYPEFKNEQFIAVGASFVLAFLAPPIGVLRPHPYSDFPKNKPFAPRMTFSETAIKQS